MASPIKLTTLKTLIKDRTGHRLEADAAELLAQVIDDKILQIIDRAGVLVEIHGKSTLQVLEMEQAIAEKLAGTGGKTVEEAFELLESYDAETLAQLVRLLEASLRG